MSDLNIAVLGAGVVGLTTAFQLTREFKNAKITIIADKFIEDTTSHVAAGIFRPGSGFAGPTEGITRKWINTSYNYWDAIRNTSEGHVAGITQLSGYAFSNEYPDIVRNQYLEKLVPLYRNATDDELQLCHGEWKYGTFFTTLLTQCSLYLPWITIRLQMAGVNSITSTIKTFMDVEPKYDVIVNCTGLGAKFLCNDSKVVPIRGQVLKVEAPWIKTFFYGNYDTYIIPGFNTVTLGGCRQYDSYDLSLNKYDTLSIKERCETLLPSLKGAKVIDVNVGLRPYRHTVRVEKEFKVIGNKKIKIVHNYGHGGYGVTTAPGTSLHAVELVREILTGNSKL